MYFLQLEVCSSVFQDSHVPPREMEGVEEGFRNAFGELDMTMVTEDPESVRSRSQAASDRLV